MTVYCFDIDGVIAKTQGIDYPNSEPNIEVIKKINGLYSDGHTIKIYTARGSRTGLDWREVTKEQLEKWGVKHHQLIMGKPSADLYIDDKALNIEDWMAIW